MKRFLWKWWECQYLLNTSYQLYWIHIIFITPQLCPNAKILIFFKLHEIILWKEFCRVRRKYVAAKCQILHYSALIKILVKTWQIFWWHMVNWILANYKKHRMWINLNMRKLYFSIRRESRQNLAIKCAQLAQSAPFPPLVTIAIFNLSLLHHVIYIPSFQIFFLDIFVWQI